MDTGSVAPVGSVVAPTAIVDRGGQRRRKQDESEHDHESDEVATGNEKNLHEHSHEKEVVDEVRRDEDGHIDCYG